MAITKSITPSDSSYESISDTDSNSNSELSYSESIESSKNSIRNQPSSCIFVASLASTLTDENLSISVTNHFKKFGDLKMVKVLRDSKNRPYAFVQYTNDSDANKALKLAHGSKLDGRELRCERAKVNRTLHITTKLKLTDSDINNMCNEFGEIEQLIKSNSTSLYQRRNSLNAWFVRFVYRDDAIRAFANIRSDPNLIVNWVQNIDDTTNNDTKQKFTKKILNNWENKENVFNNSFYENNNINTNNITIDKKSIFVGQLSNNVTEKNLNERFSIHGKINNITLIIKPNNIFAFIEFDTEESAASAFEKENHSIFLNKTMHVQYKETSRSQRRKSFPYYYNNRNFLNNNNIDNKDPLQINLAPPPINIYRRHSIDSNPNLTYYSNSLPRYPINFNMNPYSHYSTNSNFNSRRKSVPINPQLTTMRNNDDIINNLEGNSDISTSTSQTNIDTGTFSYYDENSINSDSAENSKKNYNYKRGSNYYNKYNKMNDPIRPYGYPSYYFQPINYHMGNYPNSHPYMVFCPMPPPPLPNNNGMDSLYIPRNQINNNNNKSSSSNNSDDLNFNNNNNNNNDSKNSTEITSDDNSYQQLNY